jgi:hypothetical protein
MEAAAKTHASSEAKILTEGVIVHATRGRLRLKIQHLAQNSLAQSSNDNPNDNLNLEQQIRSISYVTDVRFNLAAASVVIHYDPTQFPTPESQLSLLLDLQQVAGLKLSFESTAVEKNAAQLLGLDPQFLKSKLREIGGAMIGGSAGDLVGGAVGATAGGLVMGPAGVVLGSQLGVFMGGILGAKVGAETMLQIEQISQSPDLLANAVMAEKLAHTLQKRTGERIGEASGEIVGGVVGGAVLGPAGEVVGTILGGAIAGQWGEEVVNLNTEGDQGEKSSLSSLESSHDWLTKTTKAFVGETATATVGGALGKIILGPSGAEVGTHLGGRMGRFIDWNSDSNPAKTSNPEQPESEQP